MSSDVIGDDIIDNESRISKERTRPELYANEVSWAWSDKYVLTVLSCPILSLKLKSKKTETFRWGSLPQNR